jgi:hypothetical protein
MCLCRARGQYYDDAKDGVTERDCDIDLHIVVRVNFAVANLQAHSLEHRLNVFFQSPPVHSYERGEGQGFQTLSQAQIVPPTDFFLVRVIGPRVEGCPNHFFLDVDESRILQQLPSSVLVRNRAVCPVRGVC